MHSELSGARRDWNPKYPSRSDRGDILVRQLQLEQR